MAPPLLMTAEARHGDADGSSWGIAAFLLTTTRAGVEMLMDVHAEWLLSL
jgi:hypothetical protein